VDDRAACGLETRDTAGWKPALRAEPAKPGHRRKQEGAVYTPAFIARYLVEHAPGGVLKTHFEALRRQHEADAAGNARKTLADPNAYDLAAFNAPRRKALIRFREAWQDELKRLRILDPAVHSKAFDWQSAFPEVFAQSGLLHLMCTSRTRSARDMTLSGSHPLEADPPFGPTNQRESARLLGGTASCGKMTFSRPLS
jgi:hypothetical protein